MEYKVRKESRTMVEKVFNINERRGYVRSYQILGMLKSLSPEIVVNDEELKQQISLADPDGNNMINFDNFNKVAMHFIVRQRRRDSDDFAHKHLIALPDFPTM